MGVGHVDECEEAVERTSGCGCDLRELMRIVFEQQRGLCNQTPALFCHPYCSPIAHVIPERVVLPGDAEMQLEPFALETRKRCQRTPRRGQGLARERPAV